MTLPATPSTCLPPGRHSSLPPLPLRKRGGQSRNQNARKLGTFSDYRPACTSTASTGGRFNPTLLFIRALNQSLAAAHTPLDRIVDQAFAAREMLYPFLETSNPHFLAVQRLHGKLSSVILRAYTACIPAVCFSKTLPLLARAPLRWLASACKAYRVSRDGDSFFSIAKKSAFYSPLPAGHPVLATNLTDRQWVVLAPLIPPDPHLDHLTGQPPMLIAANRWGFTEYEYTGGLQDEQILQRYYKTLARYPALSVEQSPFSSTASDACIHPSDHQIPPSPNSSNLGQGRGRGRPRTSPRALLDAILWKLATGRKWDELPQGFPAMPVCRKYYRRLFLSGRFYTLMLALYNHMRSEMHVDLFSMLESDAFTATPSGKLALSPSTPASSENYTALLFMQMASSARLKWLREYKQTHPYYELPPLLRGTTPLSTGCLPGGPALVSQAQAKAGKESQLDLAHSPLFPGFDPSTRSSENGSMLPPSDTPFPKSTGSGQGTGLGLGFQPLERSPAWQAWRRIERDQKIIADHVRLSEKGDFPNHGHGDLPP